MVIDAPRDLLIVLSSDHTAVALRSAQALGRSGAAVTSLSDAVRAVRHGVRPTTITLVGARDDIGYSVAVAVVAAARPRRVIVVDPGSQLIVQSSQRRFVVGNAPVAAAQALGSLGALGVQSVAARVPARRKPPGSKALRALTYLRPVIGTSAAVGGAITHTHEVIKALAAEGVSVVAVTNQADLARAGSYPPEARVEWDVRGPDWRFGAIPASTGAAVDLALVRAGVEHASVSDAIYQRHSRFSVTGTLVAALAQKPLFLEYNGPEDYFGEHWQKTPLLSRLTKLEAVALRSADRIFVVSTVIRDDLLDRGFRPERIVVNPNGVDPERFDRGGGAELRSQLQIDRAETVVGFVGSFGPWHGAPVLARAFVRIAHRRRDVRLFLVGDGPEKAEVLEILTRGGAGEAVIDAGQVPSDDIPAYLDACDVLASPHCPIPGEVRFFGSPTKLFEYMSAGKGIVASSLEQIGEVLEHGRSAILVEPGDDDAFERGLLRLIEDPVLADRLGREAQHDAQLHHTWRRNAQMIEEAYAAWAAGVTGANDGAGPHDGSSTLTGAVHKRLRRLS